MLYCKRFIYFKTDLLWAGSIHLMRELGRLRTEAVDRTREREEKRRDEARDKKRGDGDGDGEGEGQRGAPEKDSREGIGSDRHDNC